APLLAVNAGEDGRQRADDYIAYNLHAFSADLVQRILSRMPIGIPGTIIKIDYVYGGNARSLKNDMVVAVRRLISKEILSISGLPGGIPDRIYQPGSRFAIAADIEVLVADHIHKEHCPDTLDRPVSGPFFRQVPAAISVIHSAVVFPFDNSFLTVEKDEPYRILRIGPGQDSSHLQNRSSAGAAVI